MSDKETTLPSKEQVLVDNPHFLGEPVFDGDLDETCGYIRYVLFRDSESEWKAGYGLKEDGTWFCCDN